MERHRATIHLLAIPADWIHHGLRSIMDRLAPSCVSTQMGDFILLGVRDSSASVCLLCGIILFWRADRDKEEAEQSVREYRR